jgi:hypothetical protein
MKKVWFYILLFSSTILFCEENGVLKANPLFIGFFKSMPTIEFNLKDRDHFCIRNVSYIDIKNGVIDYGDNEKGVEEYFHYVFKDNKIIKYYREVVRAKESVKYSIYDILYETNKITINFTAPAPSQRVLKKTYSVAPGKITTNDTKIWIDLPDVAIFDDNTIKVWNKLSDYTNGKINNIVVDFRKDVTITTNSLVRAKPINRYLFINGLMDNYLDFDTGVQYKYITNAQTGNFITYRSDGTVQETMLLYREFNKDNYLVKQKIESIKTRGGTEYYILYIQ